LGIGLLRSALLLMSFVGVLWWLSDQVLFAVGEDRFTIPGYLVWCALAYALSGSWLTWRMGRPLIRLNAERYAREAELRFALVRVNEHAEGIALHGGEADERGSLNKPIEGVVEITRQLAYKLARLTWITSGYGWLALVVPILVAAPGYFQDSLSFGELMMAVGAFMVGRIDRVELSRWIDRGWIMPAREGDKEPVFSEADIARIQMICDVRHDLLVEEETIPLVLSLLDQIYALRHQRNTLADAIRRRPEAVRTAILRQLRELDPDRFDT
ncbi:MAG: chaperone modulator CbpM, partial [Geminicoccaceae bacterium]